MKDISTKGIDPDKINVKALEESIKQKQKGKPVKK